MDAKSWIEAWCAIAAVGHPHQRGHSYEIAERNPISKDWGNGFKPNKNWETHFQGNASPKKKSRARNHVEEDAP